jgi:hypothetical protein
MLLAILIRTRYNGFCTEYVRPLRPLLLFLGLFPEKPRSRSGPVGTEQGPDGASDQSSVTASYTVDGNDLVLSRPAEHCMINCVAYGILLTHGRLVATRVFHAYTDRWAELCQIRYRERNVSVISHTGCHRSILEIRYSGSQLYQVPK